MSSTRIVREAASEPATVDDDAGGPTVSFLRSVDRLRLHPRVGRAGFVTKLIANLGADPAAGGSWIYSVTGLVFAYASCLIPRVALSLYPVFANLDLRPAPAARTLGTSRARAF